MSVLKFSKPTPSQIQSSVERVVGVFMVAFLGQWALTNYALNKVALHSAALAGVAAVYQVLLSYLTTL